MRKSKAFAILSVVVVAAVIGSVIFSVSASRDPSTEEEATAPPFCWRIHNRLLDSLDDEQRATLRAMLEANRVEIKAQLEAWAIEMPEWQGPTGLRGRLTDEQLEELRAMQQEFRDAVNAKLDAWGVEIPECRGGMGFPRMRRGGFGPFKP